jgi:hypothetical protein
MTIKKLCLAFLFLSTYQKEFGVEYIQEQAQRLVY